MSVTYSEPEHRRIRAAVWRAGGDWHQAFHQLANRGSRKRNLSWSTFVEYASSKIGTVEVLDDDQVTPDVAESVCEQLAPPDPTPHTDARIARVQAAVWSLPARQRDAVFRWSLDHVLTDTEKRNLRRAFATLRAQLEDLATGAHRLRESTPPTRQPRYPITRREGVPVHEHPPRTPRRMLDGIEQLRAVRPVWTSQWKRSVIPVPARWADHDVVEGICEQCSMSSRPARSRPGLQVVSIQQEATSRRVSGCATSYVEVEHLAA